MVLPLLSGMNAGPSASIPGFPRRASLTGERLPVCATFGCGRRPRWVIRTSVPAEAMSSESTVRAYKSLAQVERAFRCLKTVDLHVRPIYHRLDDRIRGHVFLCVLAYYVEWHMRQKLAPILFDDHDKQEAHRLRESIVAPAPRSAAARRKDQRKRTDDEEPVHSLRTLLEDLGTLAKNRVRVGDTDEEFYLLTRPTPLQHRALDLLGIKISP